MDQLPVSLISTDLKYTLSSLKIKTLQKARQYYVHQQLAIQEGVLDVQGSVGVVDKLQKIKKYLGKYDRVREQVWNKINFIQKQHQQQRNQIQENHLMSTEQVNQQLLMKQSFLKNNIQSQMNDSSRTQSVCRMDDNDGDKIIVQLQEKTLQTHCLSLPAITEITGNKGSGKTSLALYFSQIFSTISSKKIYFINCSAGITYYRFQRLQKKCPNLQYRDSYQLQHVLKVCQSAVKDQQTGCVVVDGLTNLLMEEQKTLVFLLKLFKIFTNLLMSKKCKIVLTNYVQQVFEHTNQNQQLTNHYTYYSSVTSQFIKYKFYLKRCRKDRVQVRLIRGGNGQGEFIIGKDGVREIGMM